MMNILPDFVEILPLTKLHQFHRLQYRHCTTNSKKYYITYNKRFLVSSKMYPFNHAVMEKICCSAILYTYFSNVQPLLKFNNFIEKFTIGLHPINYTDYNFWIHKIKITMQCDVSSVRSQHLSHVLKGIILIHCAD